MCDSTRAAHELRAAAAAIPSQGVSTVLGGPVGLGLGYSGRRSWCAGDPGRPGSCNVQSKVLLRSYVVIGGLFGGFKGGAVSRGSAAVRRGQPSRCVRALPGSLPALVCARHTKYTCCDTKPQTDNPIPRSRPGPGPPMAVMGIHTHHIACELQLPQFPTSQGPPGSPKAVLPASNCQPRRGTGGRSTRPGEKLAASVAERVFGWWD